MLTEMSTGITTFLFNLIIMQYFGEDGVAAVTIIMYIYYFFIAVYMGMRLRRHPLSATTWVLEITKKSKRLQDTVSSPSPSVQC